MYWGLLWTASPIIADCHLRASSLASVAGRGGASAVMIDLSFVQVDFTAENDPRCREVQATLI
jgi:hypothetical protein